MTLKDYQVEGVAFLQQVLEDTSKGSAFLADEMGLGKTSKLAIFLWLVEFFLTEHFSTITLCYSGTIQKAARYKYCVNSGSSCRNGKTVG